MEEISYVLLRAMKFYDYTKARRIIRQLKEKGKRVEWAILGMDGDWDETYEVIYTIEKGFKRKLPQTRVFRKAIKDNKADYKMSIRGFFGSLVNTPTLQVKTEDGVSAFDCFFKIKWFVSFH